MQDHAWNNLDAVIALPDLTMTEMERAVHEVAGDYYVRQFKNATQSQNYLHLAINAYMQDLELNDSVVTLAKLARVYLLNGQFDAARQFITRGLSHPNRDAESYQMLLEADAFLTFRYGKPKVAQKLLKTALKLEKPWKAAKLHLALAGITFDLNRQKSSLWRWASLSMHLTWGSALYAFTEPSAVIPHFVSMARLLSNRFCSTETALNKLFKLYARYPGLELLSIEIGNVYNQADQYTEAEFWYRRTIERHPSRDEAYRKLVSLYQNTHCYANLVDTLKQWLTLRPHSGELMLALSQALTQQSPESTKEAIDYAKQAMGYLKEPSLLASAYNHIGYLYTHMQLTDAAITAYQAAINLEPDCLETYVQLGTLYYDNQELHLSQQTFEQALALSPHNARILCNVGYLSWLQGNVDAARDYYNQSIALDPSYDIALNNLGVLYLDHIGDVQQAMYLFDLTLQQNPSYALCHYNKGRAYSFLGQPIAAARCFQKAQELNVTTQELDNGELTDRIRTLFDTTETVQNTD